MVTEESPHVGASWLDMNGPCDAYGDVWMKPDSRRLHRAVVAALEE